MQPYPPDQPPQQPYSPQTPPPPPTAPGGWQTPPPPPYPPAPGQQAPWQGGPPPQGPRKKRKIWPWVVGVIAALVLISTINAIASGGRGIGNQPDATTTQAAATQAQSQPTQASTPTATPTPKPSFATFGDGTWQVGKDIKPGTYRTRQGSPGCYWARLKGFGGSVGDILANDNTDDPAIVTISSSDKGFDSRGCGTWTSDLSQITSSKTTFTDGMYFVKTDIAPGTYKSSGQTGCYWARLSNFSGGIDSIIANDNTDSPAIVTISSGDKGFESKSCGTWTKQ